MPTLELAHPFRGRWLVQNSPADRVPSHGTTRFASSYAIDLVPVDERGRSARFGIGSLLRPEAPERFPGFGRGILTPVAGTVVAVHAEEPDHPAYRGFPSVGYALRQPRRVAAGWIGLAGNHVLIATETGPILALCHLQQHSIVVDVGQRLAVGDPVGSCGNSGNSTEPHLHLQAVAGLELDRLDPAGTAFDRARAVPITIGGGLPRNGEIVDA